MVCKKGIRTSRKPKGGRGKEEMELRWLRTASVECLCDGKYILIDPFFVKEDKAQNQILSEAARRADLILITHPHFDHFSDIAEIMKLTDAPVYVAGRGWEIARRRVPDVSALRMIFAGKELKLSDNASIKVWQSRHIRFDSKLCWTTVKRSFQLKNLKKALKIIKLILNFKIGKDDIFGFEITEGKTSIFVLGSANLSADVDYPRGMDCLLYPFQGKTYLAEYSEAFMERLQPKRVLLTHYDDSFPPVSSRVDTSAFREKYPIAAEAEFDKVITI